MPFGLQIARGSFQRRMDHVLAHLDLCSWYLGNVIVAAISYDQHLARLQKLFQRLQDPGLVFNWNNVFQQCVCEILGTRGYSCRYTSSIQSRGGP